jgi:PAS domain S-box-containing protein
MSAADRWKRIRTFCSGWLRTGPRRYGFALATVVAATLLRYSLTAAYGYSQFFSLLYLTILLVALLAGFGPGLFATVLSAVLADYLFIEPVGSFQIRYPYDAVGLALFIAVGTVISVFGGLTRQHTAQIREFERVVQGLEEMVAVVNHDYACVAANQAYLNYWGVREEQIIGCRFLKTLDSEVFEAVVKGRLDECFRGKIVRCEMRHRYPSLGERVFLISCYPIEGPGGAGRAACVLQDVTEKNKQTAEALLASEERLRSLYENATVGLYRTTPEGRILLANPSLVKMLGYSSFAELAERNLEEEGFEPGYERADFKSRLAQEGEVRGIESSWTRKDGAAIFVRESAKAIRDTEGKIAYYEGTVEDISERKQAEEALRGSEERYRMLFERGIAGVALTSLEGEILDCNETWAHLLGYENAGERRGRSIREHYVRPGDREAVLVEYGRTGVLSNREVEFRRKDGSVIWVLSSGIVVKGESGPVIQSTIVDITAQKRAEEALSRREQEYRTLLDNTPDLIVRYDKDLRRIFVNPAWEGASGYSAKDVIGLPITDITWPSLSAEYVEKLRCVLENGTPQTAELSWKDARGAEIFHRCTIVPEYDRSGKIVGVLAVGHDDTAVKQAEQERAANLRFFEGMDKVNRAILGTKGLAQMMNDVLDTVLSIFDCDRAFLLYPCDPEAKAFTSAIERTRPEYPGFPATTGFMPIDEEVAQTLRVVLGSEGPMKADPVGYPLPSAAAKQFNIQSAMSMALYPKTGKPWQFGIHQCSYPRAWRDEETKLLDAIGRRLGDALTSLLAHRDLQESESKLAEAERIAHVGYWDYDIDAQRIEWSEEARRIYGLSPEMQTITLSRLREQVPQEEWDNSETALAKVMAGAKQYEVEHRVVRPNGDVRFVHSYGDVVKDESGRPLRMFGTVQDITERKRAEAERSANLRFFESMDRVNRAMQGTSDLSQMLNDVLDEVLSIFDCDRAYLNYPCDPEAKTWTVPIERTRPQYPGAAGLVDIVPMDEEVAQVFRILLSSDGPVEFGPEGSHPLPRAVASQFHIQSSMSMALYPKTGKPWQFGIHQCSHARVWTDEETRLFDAIGRRLTDALSSLLAHRDLQESESKLAEAERIAHVGYWVYDINAQRVEWSEEACRIHGMSLEMQTISLSQLREQVPQEDWDISETALAKVMAGAKQYEVEYRVIRPNGEVRFVHEHADVVRDEEGRPVRMFGTVQDITERKRAEEALFNSRQMLQAVLDNIPQRVFWKDRNLRYVACNKPLALDAGYQVPDDLLGKTDYDMAWVANADLYRTDDRAVIGTGRPKIRYEEPQLKADGSQAWLMTSKVPMYDRDGQVIGVLGTYEDITDRKQAEEALKQRDTFSQSLLRLSRRLERSAAYAEVLAAAQEEIESVLGYKHLVVYLLTDDRRFFKALAARGPLSEVIMSEDVSAKLEIAGDPMAEEIARAEGIVVVEDARTDDRTNKRIVANRGLRTIVNVPVFLSAQRLGTISTGTAGDEGVRPPTVPEQEYLTAMASHMAVTLDRIQQLTERKQAEEALRQSEERFRVALQESPTTVFHQDRELRYTWIFNSQLYPGQDVRGKTDEELFGKEEARRLTELKRRVLQTGAGAQEEIVITRQDHKYSFEVTLEPLRDAKGEVVGITGAAMDIARLRELADSLKEAQVKLVREKQYLENEIREDLGLKEIIGQSAALQEVLKETRVVAPTDSSVLLLGETGTGKELVARAVHSLSARKDKNFIKLNCAAVPTGLLESELFGHEKGAFTSAVSQKVGRLELADKGTLFLDEVGELPLELQPKLLRVLQDREFERLGGVRTLRVDVRIISATNRDLRMDIAEKRFREDLFYRLNVFPISLPPLRERRSDIPLLVHHFVRKYAARMGKRIETIPDETMRVLENWSWPGNIRELENMIERMVILSKGEVLAAPPLELEGPQDLDGDNLTEVEREHIIRVLQETNGVLSGEQGAASRLGLKRTTLQSMLKRLGIEPQDFRRGTGTFGRE